MKPDWKDAPEWAQWLAQDANGEWCWHEREPYRGNFCLEWYCDGEMLEVGRDEPNPNWRDTPERRPAKHTAEPWREGKAYGSIVADDPTATLDHDEDAAKHYGGNLVGESITPSNRRRILACVNACKGLKTEWLEQLVAGGRTLNDEVVRVLARVSQAEGERRLLIEALRPLAAMHTWTIADAIRARDLLRELGEWPKPETRYIAAGLGVPAEQVQRDLDAVEFRSALPIHPRAMCGTCKGTGKERFLGDLLNCGWCHGTGRRHVNGKPFYSAEEVAAHNASECACKGFPGGMGRP